MPDRRRRARTASLERDTDPVSSDPSIGLPALAEAVLRSKTWSGKRNHWDDPKCLGSTIVFGMRPWRRAVAIRPPSVLIGHWHACVVVLSPDRRSVEEIEFFGPATIGSVLQMISFLDREVSEACDSLPTIRTISPNDLGWTS